MKPVLYLSGPMSNMPAFNFPAFHAAAAKLRAEGYTVVNPAELDEQDHGKTMAWEDYMRRDIRALMDCTAIAMLPGWQNSRGATWEHRIATEVLGMPVMLVDVPAEQPA